MQSFTLCLTSRYKIKEENSEIFCDNEKRNEDENEAFNWEKEEEKRQLLSYLAGIALPHSRVKIYLFINQLSLPG